MPHPPQQHPKGTSARVLLSSVFGPYAQDDEFGSRAINPMELYHNQVTREQGPFSLRMFHRSWGIMLHPAQHLGAVRGARLPDARALRRGADARSTTTSSASRRIIVNVGKVREMCRLVREHSPHSHDRRRRARGGDPGHRAHDRRRPHREGRRRVVVPRVPRRGPPTRPIAHPVIPSSFGFRVMGLPRAERRRQPGGDDHPVGRLPDGLQLLHDVGVLRRQGQGRSTSSRTGEELFDVDVRRGGARSA